MPVPLFKHSFLRRANGQPKAHAHAAYLSGTRLADGFGAVADFTAKGGVCHAELSVPADTLAWVRNRGELWRRLEARESRTTRPGQAILAHKFIGALPHELTLQENLHFVRAFVQEQFMRHGYAADWAIHLPDRGGDQRNYHVHIMVPLRRFEGADWARTKDRFPRNTPALSHFIRAKQAAYFELQNHYLAKNGVNAAFVNESGRWRVVSAQEPVRSTWLHARNHFAAAPMPSPGGTGRWLVLGGQAAPSTSKVTHHDAITPQAAMRTAARELLCATHTALDPQTARRRHSLTNSWPEKAIRDWRDWGHKAPAAFFAAWPQLTPPGFTVPRPTRP